MRNASRTICPNLVLGLLLSAGLVIASGCGKKTPSTSSSPSAGSGHFHSVTVQNIAFLPGTLNIAPGDTVRWTNNDQISHTVTSDAGGELGGSLPPGGTYDHVFASLGTFPYHCSFHSTMHGTVIVQ